jgi:hypothetical protein
MHCRSCYKTEGMMKRGTAFIPLVIISALPKCPVCLLLFVPGLLLPPLAHLYQTFMRLRAILIAVYVCVLISAVLGAIWQARFREAWRRRKLGSIR